MVEVYYCNKCWYYDMTYIFTRNNLSEQEYAYALYQISFNLYHFIMFFVEKVQLAATNFCHDTSFMTVSLCENLVVRSRFYAASHVQMSVTWQPFDMSKNKTFSTRKQRKTSAQKTFCRLILTFCFDLSSYQNIQKKTLLAETFLWMLGGICFVYISNSSGNHRIVDLCIM